MINGGVVYLRAKKQKEPDTGARHRRQVFPAPTMGSRVSRRVGRHFDFSVADSLSAGVFPVRKALNNRAARWRRYSAGLWHHCS